MTTEASSGNASLPPGVIHSPAKPAQAHQDHVVETLHGIEIVDPYRWLEDQDSPETRAWIEAQDAYTRAVLAQTPARDQIAARLNALTRIDTVSIPLVRNNTYFFTKRASEQELPVIYRRIGLEGTDEVLIDPHTLSEDKTTSVSVQDVARDATLLAYGIRHGGEDEVEIRLIDLATKTDLSDVLPRARYLSVALSPDKRTLYYAIETDNGPRAYYHRLGTDLSADVEIFGDIYEKGKYLVVSPCEDTRYLLYTVYYGAGATKTDLYLQTLAADPARNGPILPLMTNVDARFGGDIADNRLYLQTNWNAPNERLIGLDLSQIDLSDPKNFPPAHERWHEIIPTRENAVMEGASLVGGHVIVNYLENVRSHIQIHDAEGQYIRDIDLPTLGSASGLYGEWSGDEAFYSFTSFAVPNVVYRYDLASGETRVWAKLNVPIQPDQFEVTQVFYPSKDGTQIPMFLVHARGLKPDGERPTLLYGYGGFSASLTPYFSSFATVWAEHGGVYAVANLRGGGEFGEHWHQAGMGANKQNTFDDFVCAAQWLVDHSYTRPEKLAIMGGSNGGLLVGAALTQRPDLFGAVICAVPLLDMIRYHKFLVASYWIPEYGSSDDPEQFKTLYAYSPYHHVTPGTSYPAVLFVTGDADTRVAPLHARKMAALLQSATGSDRPILLHYDTKSGHMGTKPIGKVIEDTTDELCFLFRELGIADQANTIESEK